MSAERCRVCGALPRRISEQYREQWTRFECGANTCGIACPNAERLATEREKEINALHRRLAEARKIIMSHVPDDIGPIAAMECGEWVKWCDGYLESKGVSHE